ncbi:nucleoporin Nic96 [Schizosaccharomyces cryophilus OY26]|uniref:Nuclear pore protein n=1 Tax=Schizosaccharomyces cryophilus (strain OY26 / ATCC MYA-4695 / CBS 11777 / NBRC 106824 / NRRL Y48691) TaxID=653667 RepID=S9X2G7_SCHCR|nr:nucleoporin Nic96 [Schizosaccharomyces cryophilus OY26]EPY51287.1 nucleoporin Nic96 [Schizosaccharomyces cryophilus OY26]
MTAEPERFQKATCSLPFLDTKSRKLVGELLQPSLPFIQLHLGQLEQRAIQSHNHVPPSKDGNTKAHYLLAGSGINAERTWKKIESLSLHAKPPTTLELSFTDVDMFLKYQREKNVLHSLEALIQDAQSQFDKYLETEWQGKKPGVRKSPDTFTPQEKKLVTVTQNNARSQAFAASLKSCFSDVSQPSPGSNYISSFCQVAKGLSQDTKSLLLYETWNLLRSFISHDGSSDPSFGPKSQLFSFYEDSPSKVRLNQRIINCSRRFLEKQFFDVVNKEIANNPQAASIGGVPSVVNKIRAYINIRFSKNGVWANSNIEYLGDLPIWAFLFYLLRAGFLDEAVTYAEQNYTFFEERQAADFPTYLKAYLKAPNSVIPKELRNKLFSEFNQTLRFQEDFDPFKYAMYKIIGRCELSKTSCPSVCFVTEDYIWLQLTLAREFTEKNVAAHECFSLQDVQKLVLSYGPDYFTKQGSYPVMYFFLLMLCGLFERAIEFLYPYYPTDAVHFAISCAHHGLLHTAPPKSSPPLDTLLVNDTSEQPSLRYEAMLMSYVKGMQEFDAVTSACYLMSMCEVAEYAFVCHEALSNLILITRDYVNLVGDIRADGERIAGFLENRYWVLKLSSQEEFLAKITLHSAKVADDQGLWSDSILLYHLAEAYDTVISVVNRSLGSALLGFMEQGVFPDKLISLVKNMMNVYGKNPSIYSKINYKNRETTDLLLLTVEAFHAFVNKDYEQVLSALQQLEILPLDTECDSHVVRKLAAEFRFLNDSLLHNIPGIILVAMKSINELYKKQKLSAYNNDSIANTKLQFYRMKARKIVMYSSLIDFRMPSHVLEQLNRCEIEMT